MNFIFPAGGRFVAGFDKPAVISLETITEHVEAEGFEVIGVWPCEEFGGFPFPTRGRCGDDYDFVALIERTAPTATIDVPDRVRWLVQVPSPAAPVPLAQPAYEPPPASSAGWGWVLGGAVAVGVGVAFWRHWR